MVRYTIFLVCCLSVVALAAKKNRDYDYDDYDADYKDRRNDDYYDDDYDYDYKKEDSVKSSRRSKSNRKSKYQDDYYDDYNYDDYDYDKRGKSFRGKFGRSPHMSTYGDYENPENMMNDYAYSDADYNNPPSQFVRGGFGGFRGGRGRGLSPRNSMAQRSMMASAAKKTVIKKKKKKSKTISVQKGFYIPGGAQMFGKFNKMEDCMKACELTPNCFAADFNKWTNKCFMHANATACSAKASDAKLVHFRKMFCTISEYGITAAAGLITLGAHQAKGFKVSTAKDLLTCVKKCLDAGPGQQLLAALAKQICCAIDYDFGTHACYHHSCVGETCTTANAAKNPKIIAKFDAINVRICTSTGAR